MRNYFKCAFCLMLSLILCLVSSGFQSFAAGWCTAGSVSSRLSTSSTPGTPQPDNGTTAYGFRATLIDISSQSSLFTGSGADPAAYTMNPRNAVFLDDVASSSSSVESSETFYWWGRTSSAVADTADIYNSATGQFDQINNNGLDRFNSLLTSNGFSALSGAAQGGRSDDLEANLAALQNVADQFNAVFYGDQVGSDGVQYHGMSIDTAKKFVAAWWPEKSDVDFEKSSVIILIEPIAVTRLTAGGVAMGNLAMTPQQIATNETVNGTGFLTWRKDLSWAMHPGMAPNERNRSGHTPCAFYQDVCRLSNLYQNWLWDESLKDINYKDRNAPNSDTSGFIFYRIGQGGEASSSNTNIWKPFHGPAALYKEQQTESSPAWTTEKLQISEGEKVTYKLKVENKGMSKLTGVKVTDPIPVLAKKTGIGGLECDVSSISDGGTIVTDATGKHIEWNLTLDPGATKELTFEVTAPSSIPEACTWENQAEITYKYKPTDPTDSNFDPEIPTGQPQPEVPVTDKTVKVVVEYMGPPEPDEVVEEADLILQDYELNHIYKSLLAEKRGVRDMNYFAITPNEHTYIWKGAYCRDDSGPCGHHSRNKAYDDSCAWYEINVKETYNESTSMAFPELGGFVRADNNGDHLVLSRVCGTRASMRNPGKTYNTNSLGADAYIDYGVNLTRYLFTDYNKKTDERAYSDLVAVDEKYKDFIEQKLKLKGAHIPGTVAKPGSSASDVQYRVSTARLKKDLKDTFKWTGVFTKSGEPASANSTSRYKLASRSHYRHQTCTSHTCKYGHTHWSHDYTSCTYNTIVPDGKIEPFTIPGTSTEAGFDGEKYRITLVVHSIAYKYLTKNDVPTGVFPDDTRLSLHPTDDAGDDPVPNNDLLFRTVVSVPAKDTLTYYPEVPMLAQYINPTSEDGDDAAEFFSVLTTGEEKRNTMSDFLLLYKITTDGLDGVKGTIYSDTSVGGDASLGTGHNALTSGGDFTIKADTSAIKFNMYGYALDLIDKTDNTPTADWATITQSHDVKADWGNQDTLSSLKQQFQDWVRVFTDNNKYQADFSMMVNGNRYNGFSATVGKFTKRTPTDDELSNSGTYQFEVKNGKILKDGEGWKAFIHQLAVDNECSDAEAQSIVDNWGIEETIAKSLEHSNSSLNKSQAQTIGTSVKLSETSHWYDEQTRMFVIRRFRCEDMGVSDIIAQDKMELGNVTQSLSSNLDGQVSVSLYFKDGVQNDYEDNNGLPGFSDLWGSIYDPNDAGTTGGALSGGDLIFHNVRVTGADFTLTTSTTVNNGRR